MHKKKIVLLAGNTFRARAYAQQLESLKSEEILIEGLFYGFKNHPFSKVHLNESTKEYFKNEKVFIPDLNRSIKDTFNDNNWSFKELPDDDVNSENLISELKKFKADIIVFAGYGGQILKKNHFDSRSKYLHMHPGMLPLERGSTTLYYSILNRRKFTVTAFYMTDEIDKGENVLFKEYSTPAFGVNIDVWLDNIIRADCFKNAILKILSNSELEANIGDSEEYYVIHPVLKHVALLSLKEELY